MSAAEPILEDMGADDVRQILDRVTQNAEADAKLDALAQRLWRAGIQPEADHAWDKLTREGRDTWRRVAGEAARWASEHLD